MMKTFRTFKVAVQFYHAATAQQLPGHLRNQLLRAASSIPLNLLEGRAKPTLPDQLRFFHIAMGSARECQGILLLAGLEGSALGALLDSVTAHLYKLIRNAR